MNNYFANIPGIAGPLSVAGANEKEARKNLRNREGYGKRLPAGTKLYLK